MKLIVGLGNPGKEYEKTRHNAGFMAVDLLAQGEKWQHSKNAKADYIRLNLNRQDVELLKPVDFMNNSGFSVARAIKNHNLNVEDVIVVYDELDLPLGKIRVGRFDSAGGHNGLKSIIEHLDAKNFIRVRIGIANNNSAKVPAEIFVLQKFGLLEKSKINQSTKLAAEAINMLMSEPLEKVMNKFN
ncbi:MAG: aminoacyl-tRNA hydrolase [Candidatus Komeilibacteria bacterium]|nr:aminoacyl-tRNA hydrolase [Candidatus Komeilibacteria bacterium]